METLEKESVSFLPRGSTEEIDSSDSLPEIKTSHMGAGLANLGNTCFLNVVLQCFTHTVPVVESLRACGHSAFCRRGSGGFCTVCALREHVELSLSSSGGVVSPQKLVENLSNISSSFERFQQEDAHEFLQCMLDSLQTCSVDSKVSYQSSPSQEGSFVEGIFGGRLRSQLRCCSCNHQSDTFEPLIDLSLEIEDSDSLYSALESFTQVEKIDDSEMKFTCENCKEEVSVEKQLTIDQAPAVAAFHLKRFKSDGQFVEKIRKFVEYPLELDLQAFLSSPNDGNNGELKYELYAVIVHTGYSSSSGHYFCFVCSSPHSWHELDDSKVMGVGEDYVLRQEAYILFYKRQGLPWFSSLMEAQKICRDLNNASTSPKSVLDVSDSERVSVSFSMPVVNGDSTAGEVGESVLDFSDSERIPVSFSMPVVSGGSTIGGVGAATDTTDFNPSTPPPKSSSSIMVPEEPSKVNYSIPRSHLRLVGREDTKKTTNKVMEDGRELEAVNRVLRGMPSSRSSQLLSCIAPPRGCLSESSINQNKIRKRQRRDASRSDGEASPSPSTVPDHQRLSPRSVMRGLVSRDTHLLLQFDSY